MPVQLDPRIISSSVGADVPLNDLASIYSNAANFRHQRQQLEVGDEALRQRQITNEAYRAATRPDGQIDNNVLQQYLGANMGGGQIPGIQKAQSDLLKSNAETGEKQANTTKTIQEVMYNGLKQVDNTIASLAARPDTDEKMVYGEMGRLVSAGAFDAQAEHSKTTPDKYAQDLLSTMPVGNPPALKAWLIQQGMKTADATKRLEMMLPKYDEQARGGTINQGTINQLTGERTAGPTNIPLTPTAGEVLSAQTQRRGQDVTDRRTASTAANASASHGTRGLSDEQNAALSEAINSGRLDPNRINGRTASMWADLALKNPGTDFNKLGADSALLKNAAFQQKAMVASTLPEVMDNMVKAGKKLNDPDLTEYMTQRNDALMSIAGVMRGVGMTDMAHKAETEVASPTMSPDALDAWLRGQHKSLEPRLRNNDRIMHTGAHTPGVTTSTAVPAPGRGPASGAGTRPSLSSFFK